VGDLLRAAQLGDRGGIRRVDLRRAEPAPPRVVAIDHAAGTRLVVVREDDELVEVTPSRDRRERRTDAARANNQDLHGRASLTQSFEQCTERLAMDLARHRMQGAPRS
jgi:hypothetical protein